MHFAVHVATGHLRTWMAALRRGVDGCIAKFGWLLWNYTGRGLPASTPISAPNSDDYSVLKTFTSTPISAHTFTEHKIQWEMIINYFLLYLLLFLQCSSSPVKVCNTSSANIQVSVLLGLGVWREQTPSRGIPLRKWVEKKLSYMEYTLQSICIYIYMYKYTISIYVYVLYICIYLLYIYNINIMCIYIMRWNTGYVWIINVNVKLQRNPWSKAVSLHPKPNTMQKAETVWMMTTK